jgi:hypothetical protein
MARQAFLNFNMLDKIALYGQNPILMPISPFGHQKLDFLLVDADHRLSQIFRQLGKQGGIIKIGNRLDDSGRALFRFRI